MLESGKQSVFEFEFVMQPGARAGNLNSKVNNLHCTVTTLLLNSAVFPHTAALFLTGSLISHCFAPLEVIYGVVKWVFKKHHFGLTIFHTCFCAGCREQAFYVTPAVHYCRHNDLLTH